MLAVGRIHAVEQPFHVGLDHCERCSELMRDVAIRRGVLTVIADFLKAARLDERGFERVFAAGGGPPASIGRDRQGRLMVPAITLYALVPGIRALTSDGRKRLIEYLVENFDDLVYV